MPTIILLQIDFIILILERSQQVMLCEKLEKRILLPRGGMKHFLTKFSSKRHDWFYYDIILEMCVCMNGSYKEKNKMRHASILWLYIACCLSCNGMINVLLSLFCHNSTIILQS